MSVRTVFSASPLRTGCRTVVADGWGTSLFKKTQAGGRGGSVGDRGGAAGHAVKERALLISL